MVCSLMEKVVKIWDMSISSCVRQWEKSFEIKIAVCIYHPVFINRESGLKVAVCIHMYSSIRKVV